MKRLHLRGLAAFIAALMVMAACGSSDSDDSTEASDESVAPEEGSDASDDDGDASDDDAGAADDDGDASGDDAGAADEAGAADSGGVDITQFCGEEPLTVAALDGYNDTWRKTTLAELRAEAAKCPNIEEVLYTNANGDQEKMIAAVRSYADQQVDIIIIFPDFGPALIPALRDATEAGVTVIDYFVDLDGSIPDDYAALVSQDSVENGKKWADWFGQHLVEGNVLMLGGPAGVKSSAAFFQGFSEQLAEYPGLTLLEDDYVVTNWNAVDAQKATAGLLAKHPQIDGIASDYGVITNAAVQAFQSAGVEVPAIAQIASNNNMNCTWLELQEAGEEYPYFSLEGTTALIRNALRHGVAIRNGMEDPEPNIVPDAIGIDSLDGLLPRCDEDAPPDADLYSSLTAEELEEVFAGT